MKELTQYQCEYCGKAYDSPTKCQACETYHYAVDSVVQYKYLSQDVGIDARYPYAVVVKMKDGQIISFKR